jgi:DNA-binding HxlR family transcriptional regulator
MSDEAPMCEHFQRAAALVGKRWNPQVVRALQTGVTRFTDIRTTIPQISDAVLSERLKELEAEGIVSRTVTLDTPVRIDYRLTERGADLTKAMGDGVMLAQVSSSSVNSALWSSSPPPASTSSSS